MNPSAFISAGYYLTHRCSRPSWSHGDAASLPETIITLSPCLVALVPNLWPSACEPSARPRVEDLERLGIAAGRLSEAETWMADHARAAHEWPSPFHTLEGLRAFVHTFVDAGADVRLMGCSLPEDCVTRALEEFASGGTVGERGHALRRSCAPDPGGTMVGFEVLGDGCTEAHSVVCTGGEVALRDQLGILLNRNGLVDTLADARRAAAWATEDGHGEPVVYFPWRLVSYAREASAREP